MIVAPLARSSLLAIAGLFALAGGAAAVEPLGDPAEILTTSDGTVRADAASPKESEAAPVARVGADAASTPAPTRAPAPPPVTKPVTEAVAPVVKAARPPVVRTLEAAAPVASPVAKAVAEVAEPVARPVEPVGEPVAKPVTDVVEPVVEPVRGVARPVMEPITKVAEPIAESLTEPLRPVLDPAVKPVAPVLEPATEVTDGVVGPIPGISRPGTPPLPDGSVAVPRRDATAGAPVHGGRVPPSPLAAALQSRSAASPRTPAVVSDSAARRDVAVAPSLAEPRLAVRDAAAVTTAPVGHGSTAAPAVPVRGPSDVLTHLGGSAGASAAGDPTFTLALLAGGLAAAAALRRRVTAFVPARPLSLTLAPLVPPA